LVPPHIREFGRGYAGRSSPSDGSSGGRRAVGPALFAGDRAPPADNNLVVVSHKPNIVDAFGKDWLDVREGEASVFEPDGDGGYKLIVRIQASEWGKLAQPQN
jgi:hypothetical protein